MKISYNWLSNYIDTNISLEECAKILTSIGLEVESIETVEQISGGLEGVVVGEVIECFKHPDADKLSVTKVYIGTEDMLQIVCGAPNVAQGQKVLVATVGTTLNFTTGETIKIKRSKIRGVESMGMICAEDELGIGESHDGIIVLESSAVPGTAAKDQLNLTSDTIFEIGLTPNRVDAASHIGVARDLNAYLNFNKIDSALSKPSVSAFEKIEKSSSVNPAKISIMSPDGCSRYCGLSMDNVKVKSSPEWLQSALRSIGVRPINNVVDVTNYVLHETGHPLHAFDLDKIEGREIIVRRAKEGEHFTTLDNINRVLNSEDLMICDAEKPMCIAGVFGGEGSGVTEKTTSIFLESAYFNPVSVRKSSKRHSLKTDASFRFERGADPGILEYALKRAAILLSETADAKLIGEIIDIYPKEIECARVSVSFSRMESLIGKEIGEDSIIAILHSLDYVIKERFTGGAVVDVPLYRVDVTRECDIVEDVLRIYGYNNIELPLKMSASTNTGVKPDPEKIRSIVSNMLVNNGFFETMNNSLTKSEYYSQLKSFPIENSVTILNPLSSDLDSMRQTLLLNGLEVISYNINRQRPDLKLFEIGNVYKLRGEQNAELGNYQEDQNLSLFITGNGYPYWRGRVEGGSYFMLKGYLESLFKRLGCDLNELDVIDAPDDLFSEGLEFKSQSGERVAIMGTISQLLLKKFDIKQSVYGAEINWNYLYKTVKKNRVLYSELPKYPEVTRDLALLLDESVTYKDIRSTALKAEKKMLKNVVLFDVYRGDKIPAGKKQYAVSFTLQDTEKTLTDKSVEDIMNRLLQRFIGDFGATLR